MPLADRSTFQGLNTDLPPDQLGDQAMRLLNVMPASAVNVRPRFGCSASMHIQPAAEGRNVVVTALPDDLGQGVLVVVTNTTAAASGAVSNTIKGLYVFRPPLIATEYQSLADVYYTPSLFTPIF